MSQFITLKKSDPRFLNYLQGTFSSTEVALPVQSLNVGTQDETVTFEIKPLSQVPRPRYIIYLAYLIKIKSYLFILVPLFFVISKNYLYDRFFDPFSLTFAAVSTLILYAGFNIRSEVNDHVSGYDRVISSSQPRPLALGWITPHDASFLSVVLILFGFFLSVPVLILQYEAVRAAVIIAILYVLGQFFRKNSFKNQRFGEIIFFILIGPGVSSGYQVSLGAGVNTEVLAFGVLWGTCVLFLLHLNNFSHLLESSQSGVHNTMTKLGFDRSKKFLIIWLIVMNLFWFLFHFFYASTFWLWFSTMSLIFWSLPTAIRISEISSPVGSDLLAVKKRGYINFLLMVFLFYLEYIWYLGQKMSWSLW